MDVVTFTDDCARCCVYVGLIYTICLSVVLLVQLFAMDYCLLIPAALCMVSYARAGHTVGAARVGWNVNVGCACLVGLGMC